MLYEVGEPIEGDKFREALIAATTGYTVQWCKADYAAPFEDEAVAYELERPGVDLLKFERRFFFSTQVRMGREPGQRQSAVDILAGIMGFAESAVCSGHSRPGERFWRGCAFVTADGFDSSDALGTPAPDDALISTG